MERPALPAPSGPFNGFRARMIPSKVVAVALRRGWVVVLAGTLAAAVGYGLSSAEDPSWKATAVLVVPAADPSSPSLGRPTEANRLAATYAVLLPRDVELLEATAGATGFPPESISPQLTVINLQGTSLVEVSVASESEARTRSILRSFVEASTGPEPASRLLVPGSLQIVRLGEPVANLPRSPTSSAIVGAILGTALGLVIAIFWERADPRVDTPFDLETTMDVPTSSRAELTGLGAGVIWRRWVELADGRGDVVLLALGRSSTERARLLMNDALEHGGMTAAVGEGATSPIHLRAADASDLDALDRAGLVVLVVGRTTPVADLVRDQVRLAILDRPVRWAVFDD